MLKVLKTAEFATAMDMCNGSIAMAFANGKLVRNQNKMYDIEHPVNALWIKIQEEKGKTFKMSRIFEKQEKKKAAKLKKQAARKKQIEIERQKAKFKKQIAKDKQIEKQEQAKIKLKEEKIKLKQKQEQQKKESKIKEKPKSIPKSKPKPIPKPEKKSKIIEHIEYNDEVLEQKPVEVTVNEAKANKTAEYYEKKRELELEEKRNKIKLDKLKIEKMEGKLIPFDEAMKVFLFAAETFKSTYQQEADAITNIYIKILGGSTDDFSDIKKSLISKINDIQKLTKENLIHGLENIREEYREVRGRGERK